MAKGCVLASHLDEPSGFCTGRKTGSRLSFFNILMTCPLAGLGGLGQMGIKIAKAMGCVVTAVSRSEGKRKFAMDCGATGFVSSSDSAAMSAVMSLVTPSVLNSLVT